jgi:hypothetical protein
LTFFASGQVILWELFHTITIHNPLSARVYRAQLDVPWEISLSSGTLKRKYAYGLRYTRLPIGLNPGRAGHEVRKFSQLPKSGTFLIVMANCDPDPSLV